MSDIVVYNNGEIELNMSIDKETIWLTQKQLSKLFDKDVRTINDHIKTIYKEDELQKNSTIRKFRIVQKEGNREVSREVAHYNLDIVISVGYRVNSKKATKFRQWATKVLKRYITNGYSINGEKITYERFISLEKDVQNIKNRVKNITNSLRDKNIKPKEMIFYQGEYFDAYSFISKIIKMAKKSIILIDNYIDEKTLTLLSKNQNVDITIYTHTISKQLKLDLQKYNKQYKTIGCKIDKSFHDRYLLIDDLVYNIGASIKDVGNKTFTITLLNDFTKKDILREQ